MDMEIIKQQAKEIIDKFVSELEKIKVEEEFVERRDDRRIEKVSAESAKASEEFRKIMFENAPQKKGDCILAEKGKWTK